MEYSCIETKWGIMFHNQNDKDSLLQILATKGTYQPYVISEAKNHVKKDGWIIDVGANIGAHTVPIAKIDWIGGVHSFEACPDNVKCLVKNIKTHDLTHRVNIHNNGLASCKKQLTFYQVTDKGGASSFDKTGLEDAKLNPIMINCLPLDNWLPEFIENKQRIDFIKIDVQNFEYQVLLGAKRLLEYYHPAILVECPARNLYEQTEYQKITHFLAKLDYHEVRRHNKDCLFITK